MLEVDRLLLKVGIIPFPFQVSVCNSILVLFTSAGHLAASTENLEKVL